MKIRILLLALLLSPPLQASAYTEDASEDATVTESHGRMSERQISARRRLLEPVTTESKMQMMNCGVTSLGDGTKTFNCSNEDAGLRTDENSRPEEELTQREEEIQSQGEEEQP